MAQLSFLLTLSLSGSRPLTKLSNKTKQSANYSQKIPQVLPLRPFMGEESITTWFVIMIKIVIMIKCKHEKLQNKMMINLLFQRPAEKDSYMVPSNTMYNQTTVSFEPISEKMSMKSVQKCPTCQTNKDRRNDMDISQKRMLKAIPWSILCVDLIGPYTIKQLNKSLTL